MNSVTILKFMVRSHMVNHNYQMMNNLMEIYLMLGLNRALVIGFISDLKLEEGKIWKITPKGFFLIYKYTSSQIYYWDMNNNMVNNSKHVRFYEGMNYLETPTPNSIQLIISLGRKIP